MLPTELFFLNEEDIVELLYLYSSNCHVLLYLELKETGERFLYFRKTGLREGGEEISSKNYMFDSAIDVGSMIEGNI